jgi:Ser/Thr protein kinase RdoA (MazF antagonist)
MKNGQKALFTDDVLAEAARRFDLDQSSLNRLDGFENMILEATRGGKPYVLRLTHSSHRTVAQVQAELDWLDFLSQREVAVCMPLRSRRDLLTEVIDTDSARLIAVVFEKAPGGFVRRDDWTETMTFNRGTLLGRMHALTKRYQPPTGQVKRLRWWDEDDFVKYREYLPREDAIVADRFGELIDTLRSISSDSESFGLIHMDAHTGNMFFDGENPTLFDFDDCAYDFFVSDIAIALFYAVLMLPSDRDRPAYAKDFLTTLLEGYRTENSLDNRWLELIPMILKRREILLYVAIHRGYDKADFDEWCLKYLGGHRQRIEDRVPVLDLDWTEFSLSS